MATLTVWRLPNADGAERAAGKLEDLQRQELITVHDAAIVSWPVGKKKPRTRQLHNMAGAGAMGGAFWGFLFGLIFFVPLLGMAVGAATGAASGALADVGIDDRFIGELRDRVTPGSSAIFVLSSDAVIDRVREAFPNIDAAELLYTNLSDTDEARLREAFAPEA